MINFKVFELLARSFPEVTEAPHFEKTSFRVRNKIFATYDKEKKIACLKLLEVDQVVFSSINNEIIYPVPNKWGKQGWTMFALKKTSKEILKNALYFAYCNAAPKKLAEQTKKHYDYGTT